jgi:hypothetical protein
LVEIEFNRARGPRVTSREREILAGKRLGGVTKPRPVVREQARRSPRFAGSVGRALRSARGRVFVMSVGGLVLVAAIVVGVVLLRAGDGRPPIPDMRARHYTEVDACLLTDEGGINAGTPSAEVWAGMQDASLRTHARVNYTRVVGEQSVGNARPFLNSLLQGGCEVVLAVGKPEVTAAGEAVAQHPKLHFVLVGSDAGSGKGNVTVVPAGKGMRSAVAEAVEKAAGKAGSR